jgi:hypothetical protein
MEKLVLPQMYILQKQYQSEHLRLCNHVKKSRTFFLRYLV